MAGIIELAKRRRSGYGAFCAFIDLLGMKKEMSLNPREAVYRLNDLQQGFGHALIFFPGGRDYRVCFLADSLLVVKELTPEEKFDECWPMFCGHVFALASYVQELETDIGNPGLRMFVSYGRLSQIIEPDSWRQYPISDFTKNWFVLTGASDALRKCDDADRAGSSGGFDGGYCWHEIPSNEREYLGTRFIKIPPDYWRQPNLYPAFYQELCKKADKRVKLPVGHDT
jgi:hypothetical protein